MILQDFCLHRDALDHQQCPIWGLEHSLGHTQTLSYVLLGVALTQTQSLSLNILTTQLQVPGADCPLNV